MAETQLPHSPISSHSPSGARCRFCCKSLTALNASGPCPDRARIERNTRLIAEIHAMEEALRKAVSKDILPEPLFLEVAALLARIDGEA